MQYLMTFVSKTQLICFRRSPCTDQSRFLFCGHLLPLSDSVFHVGNTMSFNLSDKPDIQAEVMAFLHKANFVLFRFKSSDPHVEMKLFQAYCLSFYGSSLWRLHCPELNSLSVFFNNVIRRIWNLPQRSHTSVVHCLRSTEGIHNIIFSRFCTMFNACISHASPLIRSIFRVSAQSCSKELSCKQVICCYDIASVLWL